MSSTAHALTDLPPPAPRVRSTATPAVRILIAATIASVPFAILSILDAGGSRIVWDNLHWTISAVAGAIAAAWSIRGSVDRTRAVRTWATAALILWMIATLAWAWMNLAGTPAVPSVADVSIVAILFPGIGVIVASVRGRLSAAEEAAVYLDAILAFLFIGSLLLWIFGSTALTLPTAASLAALAYPTAFIGLGAAGLISLLAVGYPIEPRGAFALLCGSSLIGVAYIGWLAPSIDLTDPGPFSSVLFTVGTLVAAYGAVTWTDDRSTNARYLTQARGATRTVAPTVASVLFLLILAPAAPSVEGLLRIAIFVASIIFIVRQGLLLRERTTMLARVTTLTEENDRLVGELRAELERRAVDQRRMIQASRAAAVGDLAAGVAHEVNNPLTGVLGFAELLIEEAGPDDPHRADLETIRDEALRARQIVRALRDFARPRRPELVATDVSTLIHQSIDLIRYSIERRGITIDEDLPPLDPILIDGSAVQQAVLNILTNARQAMQDDGHLVVSVRADGTGRLITITDDGVGMDPATARLAFEPFFSRREDPDDAQPGIGLGLSVSSGLIESHGGTIRINSEPGRGTTVEIRVPAGQVPQAAAGSQVGMVG